MRREEVGKAGEAIQNSLRLELRSKAKLSSGAAHKAFGIQETQSGSFGASATQNSLPHPTPYILFSVQDQGRGIPADKLETIFGRFQQVDTSDSRDQGGTGLGLAICQSIVQQHDGQIWAESTWGQGSTFFFTLPLQTK